MLTLLLACRLEKTQPKYYLFQFGDLPLNAFKINALISQQIMQKNNSFLYLGYFEGDEHFYIKKIGCCHWIFQS